ncbi:SH3 domain-containing protein [Pyxidicoccus sp. 3LG]
MSFVRTLRAALAGVMCLAMPALAGDTLGDPKMSTANKAAAKVLKARMQEERPEDYAVLQKVEAAEVVVVSGEYDRVQDVLREVGVPHVVVTPIQLARTPLNAKQLLIINCAGSLGPQGLEKVRKFVNAGGFLYTTDWALKRVVEKAFPGFIAANGRETGDDVVEVQVKESSGGSNLLKHLHLANANPKWWLEGSSYPIRVLAPDKVEVLVESQEMKKKYGAAPVAVLFRYGDGKVLHIASHFYLQRNQVRSVAEAKTGGKYLKEDAKLSKKAAEALANDEDVKNAQAGDIQSAYAAQQMTSNLVIERKKDQARIDQLYSKTLAAPAAPARGSAGLGSGTRVKVVEEKGAKVKVRSMEGEEAWVDSAVVK